MEVDSQVTPVSSVLAKEHTSFLTSYSAYLTPHTHHISQFPVLWAPSLSINGPLLTGDCITPLLGPAGGQACHEHTVQCDCQVLE